MLDDEIESLGFGLYDLDGVSVLETPLFHVFEDGVVDVHEVGKMKFEVLS